MAASYKYTRLIILPFLIILFGFIGYFLGQNRRTIFNVSLELTCRKKNEIIRIGINGDSAKCCKGLFAVIETKSNVRCEKPNNTNQYQPRVPELE